ncbi:MAG: YeeE/YedE family protein [Deltaproteobacteria bacterium]|nr:YeeE/YedE family protein [Deltaproteobacteria bacterium]
MKHEWWMALIGGGVLGAASGLLLWANGRIAGVSGIAGSTLRPRTGDVAWRLAFLVGLALAGLAAVGLGKHSFDVSALPGTGLLVVAGVAVGLGTRYANGCTSGHGICGLSRGSLRSIVATGTFMAAAAATVFAVRHLA